MITSGLYFKNILTIISDACAVSKPLLVSSIMIVKVVPQFGGSLTIVNYAPRVISYASNIFKVQAIGVGLTDLIDDSVISIQAIIFVIDSSNRERLAESQDELVKLLSEKELRDSCLLILANKQV
jgi:hypothetical protein